MYQERLMSVMDVFLFPSIFEGIPLSLIKAQAMGIKCVVSKNISSDAFITNLVFPIGLDKPIEIWSECILNHNIQGEI